MSDDLWSGESPAMGANRHPAKGRSPSGGNSPSGCSHLSGCNEVRPYLEAFADQELPTDRLLDVERHLHQCEDCRSEVELSHHLAAVTRSAVEDVPVCPAFQARLCTALKAERRRQEHQGLLRPLPFKAVLPLAAAAAATLYVGYRYSQEKPGSASFAAADTVLVDTLLKHHTTHVQPASAGGAAELAALEPTLGFPVRPPNLDRYGARFVGASLLDVNNVHAASLHYSLADGRRVTFYVYDPEQLPLRGLRTLHPRVIGDRAVFVGQRRGYSLATCERQGIGYAVAGDVPDDKSAELVLAAER